MSDSNTNRKTEIAPEEFARLLELQLIHKRSMREQAAGRHRNIRTLSIIFFVLILGAAAFAFCVLLPKAEEARANRQNAPAQNRSGR